MTMADTAENRFMLLYFNASGWANVADNAASAPLTNIYASLATADPGDAGSQTTSESAYTSYARVAVARTSGGWTVTANSVSPVADISFPACTGSTSTITYFGLGTASSGAGVLHWSGTVTPNISVASGVTPIIQNTTTVTID